MELYPESFTMYAHLKNRKTNEGEYGSPNLSKAGIESLPLLSRA